MCYIRSLLHAMRLDSGHSIICYSVTNIIQSLSLYCVTVTEHLIITSHCQSQTQSMSQGTPLLQLLLDKIYVLVTVKYHAMCPCHCYSHTMCPCGSFCHTMCPCRCYSHTMCPCYYYCHTMCSCGSYCHTMCPCGSNCHTMCPCGSNCHPVSS